MAAWVTPAEVRAEWADAPLDDERLQQLIDAAHAKVAAYAPALPDGAPVPANYKEAELLEVIERGRARDREGDVLGYGDGFAIRVKPLSAEVKALLRPRRGVPRVI